MTTRSTRARSGTGRRRAAGPAVALGLLVLAAGEPAFAQDDTDDEFADDLADDLQGVLPADFDELGDEEVAVFLDELIVLFGGIPAASGDGSSSLTGPCGGWAFSFDGDGRLLDAAYDLGDDAPPQDLLDGTQAFTSGNPFVVDTSGTISYVGFAPADAAGPMDHSYSIEVGGVTVADGGDPNTNGKNRNAGTIDMDEEMPIGLSVKLSGSGSFTAPEFPGCEGSGHVEIDGPGLLGPVGLAGLGLTAVGVAGLFFARPARTWRA